MKKQHKWATGATVAHNTENQGCATVIALDPGVRTFLTGYSPDGTLTEFASGDAARLCKLAATVDKLSTRLDNVTVRHHERQRLKRKHLRIHSRISNLVSEMHWKSADYLCSNYDVILLPSFGSQDMAKKVKKDLKRRRINRHYPEDVNPLTPLAPHMGFFCLLFHQTFSFMGSNDIIIILTKRGN
jgi:putative transposase